MPTDPALEQQNVVRQLLGTLRAMLPALERPESTDNDRQRAVKTIRAAMEKVEHPAAYGTCLTDGRLSFGQNRGDAESTLTSQEVMFSEKLSELMKAQCITQSQLAQRTGCSQPAISLMLKRQCRPQKRTILSLAQALGVQPNVLWPDMDVLDMLETAADVLDDGELSPSEARLLRDVVDKPAPDVPTAPLPKRKRQPRGA